MQKKERRKKREVRMRQMADGRWQMAEMAEMASVWCLAVFFLVGGRV